MRALRKSRTLARFVPRPARRQSPPRRASEATPYGSRPSLGMAVVRGRSMLPTLSEGDRLLVRYGSQPVAGRLAVVRFSDGVVAVKRLDHESGEGWWVVRDSATEGRDSWSAGPIDPGEVLAMVLARIWPRPGRLAGPPTVGR